MKWMFILFLLFSCSPYVYRGGDSSRQQQQEDQGPVDGLPFNSFSTRLSNSLLISGTRCTGTEVADFDGRSFACEVGQWLVVVDNINSCTPEGCTDVVVQPTIATLVNQTGNDVITFFIIAPSIPLSDAAEDILDSVLLRVDQFGTPVVVLEEGS